MKIFDIKAAIKDVYGKTHWRTIGTVFAADDGSLIGLPTGNFDNEGNPVSKPAGFSIDYPTCQGIIVPRPKKVREPGSDDSIPPTGDGVPV
jgi:hypothetical protein